MKAFQFGILVLNLLSITIVGALKCFQCDNNCAGEDTVTYPEECVKVTLWDATHKTLNKATPDADYLAPDPRYGDESPDSCFNITTTRNGKIVILYRGCAPAILSAACKSSTVQDATISTCMCLIEACNGPLSPVTENTVSAVGRHSLPVESNRGSSHKRPKAGARQQDDVGDGDGEVGQSNSDEDSGQSSNGSAEREEKSGGSGGHSSQASSLMTEEQKLYTVIICFTALLTPRYIQNLS